MQNGRVMHMVLEVGHTSGVGVSVRNSSVRKMPNGVKSVKMVWESADFSGRASEMIISRCLPPHWLQTKTYINSKTFYLSAGVRLYFLL